MPSSIYAFVPDLSTERFLDRVGELGVGGVTIAAAYHQALDVTPHGPTYRTHRTDGMHWLPSDRFLHESPLRPPVQPDAINSPLWTLGDNAAARGLEWHTWIVVLHNTALVTMTPGMASLNCFGEGSISDLCPANPDVRRYAVALAREAASLGPDTVVAESLHFAGFTHGHHHERSVPLSATDQFLFALCFCASCLARARELGVDGHRARDHCGAAVLGVLRGDTPGGPNELTIDGLAEYAGHAVADYALTRCATVSSLIADVSDAVRLEGSRLVVLDLTGAALGYTDGHPTGPPTPQQSWQFGVDVAEIARTATIGALAYASAPERVEADVAAYVAAGARPRVVLRPGQPDTDDAPHLAAKVAAARRAGAAAIDFYAYGLSTPATLRRIPDALDG